MNWTRLAAVIMKGACVLLACCFGWTPLALAPQSGTSSKITPLVLAENEGERRVIRGWPEHPDPRETFILKVDPENGGSSHLVFMTANVAPGGEIVTHRHPGADEILFLQTGTARVQLGDSVREAHAGITVFIPAGTWVSVSNIGKEGIKGVAVFSSPGFENYMRDVSVREGECRCRKPKMLRLLRGTHMM